jgi:hypothetical protein
MSAGAAYQVYAHRRIRQQRVCLHFLLSGEKYPRYIINLAFTDLLQLFLVIIFGAVGDAWQTNNGTQHWYLHISASNAPWQVWLTGTSCSL